MLANIRILSNCWRERGSTRSLKVKTKLVGCIRWLHVEFGYHATPSGELRRKHGGRVDDWWGPNDETKVALVQLFEGRIKDFVIEALTEPDNVGTEQASARIAFWQIRYRNFDVGRVRIGSTFTAKGLADRAFVVLLVLITLGAFCSIERAMKFNQIFCSWKFKMFLANE